jgi:hypothetical protein
VSSSCHNVRCCMMDPIRIEMYSRYLFRNDGIFHSQSLMHDRFFAFASMSVTSRAAWHVSTFPAL